MTFEEYQATGTAPPEPKALDLSKPQTKNAVMLGMAMKPEGATEAEICEVLGWKACVVTLRRAAEKAGLTLTAQKQKGGKARYFVK